MPPHPNHRPTISGLPCARARSVVACLATAVAFAACQDAGGDPTALLVGEDVHPAIMLAAELPSLPGLAAQARIEPTREGALGAAADAWLGSWTLPTGDGDAARAAATAGAAAALADGLGAERVDGALRRLEDALSTVGRFSQEGLPPTVAERLLRAGEAGRAARAAFEAGVLSEAVRWTLDGADLLRGVGPEGVARTLIARASDELEGSRLRGTESETRAKRLLAGARRAVGEADYGLAIQRAYYACQLLGVALE